VWRLYGTVQTTRLAHVSEKLPWKRGGHFRVDERNSSIAVTVLLLRWMSAEQAVKSSITLFKLRVLS
jgi:hypothetical protein